LPVRKAAETGSIKLAALIFVTAGALGAGAGEYLFAYRKVNGATQLERTATHLLKMPAWERQYHRLLPGAMGLGAAEVVTLLCWAAYRLICAPLAAKPKLEDPNLKDYVLEKSLGVGGMGEVFEARHKKTKEKVAIKKQQIVDERCRERFRREARILQQLEHPGVVGYKDFIDIPDADHGYLIMEYLEGKEIDVFFSEEESVDGKDPRQMLMIKLGLIEQVNQALGYVHQTQQIIHRDLKCANVFVVRGADGRFRAKLLDFGIAKDLAENMSCAGKLTLDRSFLGTLLYAAPEMFWGWMGNDPEGRSFECGLIDHRADIYSLGVILYKLLVGREPFGQDEVTKAHMAKKPTQIFLPPDLPTQTQALVLKLLSRYPSERPQNSAEVQALISLAKSEILGKGSRYIPVGLA